MTPTTLMTGARPHALAPTIALAPIDARQPAGNARPVLDLVIPVYNEEHALEWSVRRVHAFLAASLPFACRVTVADNASTDETGAIGARLARDLPGVGYLRLEEKGRGRALRRAWAVSDADVVAYTDVDLSTDLVALPALLAPLLAGHAGVAIGSRLSPGARVTRGPKREAISRGYNLLLRAGLGVGFRDAQCGFKAVRADVARVLVPLVEDESWFFDTELLVLAERCGAGVHEVPVRWVDDPDSRVHIVATAREDLRGIRRLRRAGRPGVAADVARRRLTHRVLSGPVARAG